MNLRTVRSTADAAALLRLLGYSANPLPYDGAAVGLENAREVVRLTSGRSPARGYGVLVAELNEAPRSLRAFGKRLVDGFHDRPLAFLGLRNGSQGWRQLLIVRPRLITGGRGAVSIAKLTVEVERPTAHDAEVVSGIAWYGTDDSSVQARIDAALDVERVTRRFFAGLRDHHRRLLAAVEVTGQADAAVLAGLERARGAERVALRIVTQTLFCSFLQRKGLLEGDRAWLGNAYRRHVGHRGGRFYQLVLEPLFYELLSVPPERRPANARHEAIPFLNGGLFDRHYGDVSLPLADELFSTDEGLLGFLERWTFTVSEEAADESEVAVDPEMLGRIFENLIDEQALRREGTVYTPRPVVQFMCREALVPYLEATAELDEPTARELILDDERMSHDDPAETLALARRLDGALDRIRVLDPAVGSGAFLLGMMSELVRLRRLCHRVLHGREPTPGELWRWKVDAIEHSLFGVDINATAIELCRLRLWLSLLVEEEPGRVNPLPNLEYRTVAADSLLDYVAGVEVQQTRSGALTLGFHLDDPGRLVALRERYFAASEPAEKTTLRDELADEENAIVERLLARAEQNARSARNARAKETRDRAEAALVEQLPDLRARFASRDRVFPVFLPGFHAPDVAAHGGWDVVIMNPPYVGRKELAQRFPASYRADLERHYGRTYDLMIHFGLRAFELCRTGGAVSMIFNDSIFTSSDGSDLRRSLLAGEGAVIAVRAVARTKCFEGRAVNGGVVVAVETVPDGRALRYVENHGRPPADLAGASIAAEDAAAPRLVGRSELWLAQLRDYARLPHRPLFRPSAEALALLNRYEESAAWGELSRWGETRGGDWEMLSKPHRLERWKAERRRMGFYDGIRRSERFVLLGLVVDGGQGLATADDRRFLAAIEGSADAEEALRNRARYEQLVLREPEPAALYRERRAAGQPVDLALLEVAERFTTKELNWPKSGLVRTVPPDGVLHRSLTDEEVKIGLGGPRVFVPFEKGDDTGPDGGAKWRRDNPLAIDWSRAAVALLRKRARKRGSKQPRLQNERLWGRGGATWNRVASYLRVRRVSEGGIFSDKTPTIRPTAEWLSVDALIALLNTTAAEFIVRTFVGSRMQVELGDLHRLPIPVLSDTQAERLTDLGRRGVAAKEAQDHGESGEALIEIEAELEGYVRDLYGIKRDAELWVVR